MNEIKELVLPVTFFEVLMMIGGIIGDPEWNELCTSP
jgi:hypothetical protein